MHVLELAEGADYVGDLPTALQQYFASLAGPAAGDAGYRPRHMAALSCTFVFVVQNKTEPTKCDALCCYLRTVCACGIRSYKNPIIAKQLQPTLSTWDFPLPRVISHSLARQAGARGPAAATQVAGGAGGRRGAGHGLRA